MLSSAYHVSMEGEAPEQPKPEEAITRDGRRVRLQRGKPPTAVNPEQYDATRNAVPPEIIGETVDVEAGKSVIPKEKKIIDKKA